MGKHRGENVNNWLSRHWPLLVIAAPAAVAVWSGWVGLGGLCGFGVIHPLPGIADGLHLNTAITLPVGVEAYGAYALYAWLGGEAGPRARDFAQKSAIGALILGCLGQVAFHVLAAEHVSRAPALVVVLVACLPVVTLSFAAALTHLMHADEKAVAAEAVRQAVSQVKPVLRKPWKPAGGAIREPGKCHQCRRGRCHPGGHLKRPCQRSLKCQSCRAGTRATGEADAEAAARDRAALERPGSQKSQGRLPAFCPCRRPA